MSDRMLSGDAMTALRAIADSLSQRGIRRITGNVVAVGHFENTMKKHGVYKLKTAGAIKLLSGTYGRAGLTLRLLQCTDLRLEGGRA